MKTQWSPVEWLGIAAAAVLSAVAGVGALWLLAIVLDLPPVK